VQQDNRISQKYSYLFVVTCLINTPVIYHISPTDSYPELF